MTNRNAIHGPRVLIERRTVSVYFLERPLGDLYSKTAIFITPRPPEIIEIKFLCLVATPSSQAKAWSVDLAQIVRPVPPEFPAAAGGRLLTQIRDSLRVAIEADMLEAGLLENKRLIPLGYPVIDLAGVS